MPMDQRLADTYWNTTNVWRTNLTRDPLAAVYDEVRGCRRYTSRNSHVREKYRQHPAYGDADADKAREHERRHNESQDVMMNQPSVEIYTLRHDLIRCLVYHDAQ
jgi:hypothetical protein